MEDHQTQPSEKKKKNRFCRECLSFIRGVCGGLPSRNDEEDEKPYCFEGIEEEEGFSEAEV